ncbi:MAG: tetratricopeptide repeat protein [Myxococcales bacterium]|nr:tetratricopeptide repeat protein [Myxococcales bacterium]
MLVLSSRWSLLGLALAGSAMLTVPARAQSAPPPEAAASARSEPARPESADRVAERFNEEGKKLVAAGKYEEALEKFRQSLKLFPLSNAIFNVGSMHCTLKQYDEAHPYLEQTLRAPLDPRQREIVLNHLENVARQLRNTHAAVLVESSPPGASVAVNNKPLPFETPMRVLVPFGAADVIVTLLGFKPQTVVVNSSTQEMPHDIRVRLERDEPDAPVTVFCPKGADVFVDGTMMGFEQARTRLLLGEHIVRCGKTATTLAFERKVAVRAGPNAFEFSTSTK